MLQRYNCLIIDLVLSDAVCLYANNTYENAKTPFFIVIGNKNRQKAY